MKVVVAGKLLLASAVVVLTGCETTGSQQSPNWHEAASTDLTLDGQALGVALHSARVKTVEGRFKVQDAQWRGDSGWPRVRLVLHDLSNSRTTFASNNPFDGPLEKRIKKAFGQFTLDLGEPRQLTNQLGNARLQRFRVNDKNHCIFVGQFTAPSNELSANAGSELGQIYIEGSLCTAPGIGLPESNIVSFVKGLALKSGG